jgi:hypothetical protein
VPLFGVEEFGLINMPFLPTELVLFADGGLAWDNNLTDINGQPVSVTDPELKFSRSASEHVPVFSTGVSARFNILGFMVFETYYAYPWRPRRGATGTDRPRLVGRKGAMTAQDRIVGGPGGWAPRLESGREGRGQGRSRGSRTSADSPGCPPPGGDLGRRPGEAIEGVVSARAGRASLPASMRETAETSWPGQRGAVRFR